MSKNKFLLKRFPLGLVVELVCVVIIIVLALLVIRNLLAIYNPPLYTQLEKYTGYVSEGGKILLHLGSPESGVAEKVKKQKRKRDPEHEALVADMVCKDTKTFTHITFEPVLADPEHACSITISSNADLAEFAKLSPRLINLKILKIRNTTMTHIPPEIGKIQSLRQIIIEDTKNTVLPPEIGELQGVIELTIKNANLELLPKEIGSMRHLEKIMITDNKELRSIPPEIGNLAYVWWIDLSNNSLEALPDTMSNNQSLSDLYLNGNRFSHFPLVLFKMRLNIIELNNNVLEEVPDISSLKDLIYLSLEDNKLTAMPKGWQNVDLTIDGNKIPQNEMEEYVKVLKRRYPEEFEYPGFEEYNY